MERWLLWLRTEKKKEGTVFKLLDQIVSEGKLTLKAVTDGLQIAPPFDGLVEL